MLRRGMMVVVMVIYIKYFHVYVACGRHVMSFLTCVILSVTGMSVVVDKKVLTGCQLRSCHWL